MNTLISGAARRRNAALRGGLLLACTLGAGLAQAQNAASLGGIAHGGSAKLSHALLPEIKLGRVAVQHMPCLPREGVVYSNGVDSTEASAPSGGLLGGPNLQLRTGIVSNSGELSSAGAEHGVDAGQLAATARTARGAEPATGRHPRPADR